MQIAVHMLAYNVNRFIDYCLENAAPHVDKIFITYSERPWAYNATSRQNNKNPTSLERVKAAVLRLNTDLGISTPVEIITGDWETDEETRNAALIAARSQNFDWLLIQDADEFYTRQSWDMLKASLLMDRNTNCFRTTWYLFWKSSQLVIEHHHGSIKDNNVAFAIRCKSDVEFLRSRTTTSSDVVTIDASCYHYAYVMDDLEIKEKVTTWGHTHQFNPQKWLNTKWIGWTSTTRNLHPVHPMMWARAIRFPGEQPEFAKHFSLHIDLDRQPSLTEILNNLKWDAAAKLRWSISEARAALDPRSVAT